MDGANGAQVTKFYVKTHIKLMMMVKILNLIHKFDRGTKQDGWPKGFMFMTGLSFEFYPPKSLDAAFRLADAVGALAPFQPNFVSVTYGAGGTTRKLTHEAVQAIGANFGLNVAAHLTCVDASRAETIAIAEAYAKAGVSEIDQSAMPTANQPRRHVWIAMSQHRPVQGKLRPVRRLPEIVHRYSQPGVFRRGVEIRTCARHP